MSGTSQGLAGATVQLHNLDSPSVPDQSVKTGTDGVYLFQNLPSGNYQLTETPPAGYVSDTLPVAAQSPLTPISNPSTTTNSVDVQVGNASGLELSLLSVRGQTLLINYNGLQRASDASQLSLSVSQTGVSSPAAFSSFCVDLYRSILINDTGLPYSMEPLNQSFTSNPNVSKPQNASAIAYLYNHFGTTSITDTATAVGLQLAIWELEYEQTSTYNVLTGTSSAQSTNPNSPLTASSPAVQDAQDFLTLAENYLSQPQSSQNELAVYLNGLPSTGRSNGSQGLIAPESLNFSNQLNLNPNLPATLSGVVYVDVNNNGQYDGPTTDTPLTGVLMTLTGTDTNGNPVDLSTTTLGNGTYTFSGLPVSNAAGYTVTEAPTPAYGEGTNTPGTPVNGAVSGDTISQISVTSGDVLSNYNFGEVTGGLSGVVYVDVNNNGHYDSGTDTSLSGVQITLTGTDINGNPVDLTTNTASDGTYAFSGLLASNAAGYNVAEAATPAYGEGTNTPGNPANGTVSGDTISSVAFVGGADLNNYNFGEVTGTLTGVVYVDINNNGQYDSGTDAPVSGVLMTLTGTDINGKPVDLTTTTTASGVYDFTGILASNAAGYSITRVPAVSPYIPATNTPGAPVNGTVSTVTISTISFVGGANLASYNFGQIVGTNPALSISLSGTVFVECNNNGIQQSGEPGLAGVIMTLVGFTDSGQAVTMSTSTNSLGQYSFNVADPGTYAVTEGAITGYIHGKDTPGTAGGTVFGNSIITITLGAGTNATGYNFALLHPGSLSGYVYYDENHNGVMDAPDYGIAHVTITLDGTNDLGQSVEMTMVTNNAGFYSFGGLRPGIYEIIRTHPDIFIDYRNNVGSLGGTAGKNAISGISLPACGQGVNYDFGELQTKTCNLRNLALSVGNLFYHFERSFQASPATIAKHYPRLVPYLAAGKVPFGIAPFPKAALASYWVPLLGTKAIKIYPVKGISPVVAHPQGAMKAMAKPAHARR